jgi:hypothetical protein
VRNPKSCQVVNLSIEYRVNEKIHMNEVDFNGKGWASQSATGLKGLQWMQTATNTGSVRVGMASFHSSSHRSHCFNQVSALQSRILARERGGSHGLLMSISHIARNGQSEIYGGLGNNSHKKSTSIDGVLLGAASARYLCSRLYPRPNKKEKS